MTGPPLAKSSIGVLFRRNTKARLCVIMVGDDSGCGFGVGFGNSGVWGVAGIQVPKWMILGLQEMCRVVLVYGEIALISDQYRVNQNGETAGEENG